LRNDLHARGVLVDLTGGAARCGAARCGAARGRSYAGREWFDEVVGARRYDAIAQRTRIDRYTPDDARYTTGENTRIYKYIRRSSQRRHFHEAPSGLWRNDAICDLASFS